MQLLNACVACGSEKWTALGLPTDISPPISRYLGVASDSAYAICSQCDLVFARNRQDATDAETYYASFIVRERRDYAVYPPPQLFIDNQKRLSERLLARIEPKGKVLNIRCEAGIHLAKLRELGCEVFGIDHFQSNVRYAKERLGIDISIANPMTLDIDKRGFDLILANHQLTHAIDPMGFLRACKERLNDGGVLFLYNEIDHDYLFSNPEFYRNINDYHKQLLTHGTIESLLAAAGFVIEERWFDPVGIKWAASANSMMIKARAGTAHPIRCGNSAGVIRKGFMRYRIMAPYFAARQMAIRLARMILH